MKTEDPRVSDGSPVASTAAPPSARSITWKRRRIATARFWNQFRRNKMGMIGLAILILFGAVAIYSLFADTSALSKTAVTEQSIAPCTFRDLPCAPNGKNIFGTDADGRSVLALVIHGSRMSLLVGLMASVITMVIGAFVGIVSGYVGRATDSVLMRLSDFMLVIPWLALAAILATIIGQNVWVIIGIIGFTSWPGAARLIREGTALHRALACARRVGVARHLAAHPSERHAGDHGEHDPDGRDRDPVGVRSVVPRVGRPPSRHVGYRDR
jgi:peptide/nickel transport system permease protein